MTHSPETGVQGGDTEGAIEEARTPLHLVSGALEGRRALLHAARGMWRDRDDLPSLEEWRIEMNRDFESRVN